MPEPASISAGPLRSYELANCVLMLAAKLVLFIIFLHLLVVCLHLLVWLIGLFCVDFICKYHPWREH